MNRAQRRRRGIRVPGQVLGLDTAKAVCPRHLGTLPEEHPPAVGVALLGGLLAAFCAHPRIQEETGGGNMLEIGPSVERHQPLCCFLGDERFEELKAEAIRQGT